MAKVIVDYIDLGDGGMAYNYNHYTKEEAIADGDWGIINGYEQGYMQVFEECEPNDVGAFKCWVIEN